METETKQGDDILTKALSVFVNLKLFVCVFKTSNVTSIPDAIYRRQSENCYNMNDVVLVFLLLSYSERATSQSVHLEKHSFNFHNRHLQAFSISPSLDVLVPPRNNTVPSCFFFFCPNKLIFLVIT